MKPIHLPEEKLNELAQQVSEKMLAQHTFQEGVVRGEELKTFTNHPQINKFLLFQVFQVWNLQIGKLKHPYFDFEQQEIQDALKGLRNILSRHIKLNKKDLQHLLQRAAYNNLKLLLNPEEAFASFFFVNSDKTSLSLYQRYVPFFSDLDFVVNSILRYAQKNNLTHVEKSMFFEKMGRVFQLYTQKSGQHIDQYRSDILQKLTGKSLSDIEKMSQEVQRKLEEEKRQLEAERKRKEAEARQKAAEQARLKAEEEARKKAEEEKRRKEEELRKASLFDSLEGEDSGSDFFDIDEEIAALTGPIQTFEDTAPEESEPVEESKKDGPPTEGFDLEELAAEIEASLPAQEEVKPVAESPVEKAAPPELELELSNELDDVPVEEVASPVVESPPVPVVEAEVEAEAEVAEVEAPVEEETPEEKAAEDSEEEFLEMAESMEPKAKEEVVEEEKPKTLLDRINQRNQENGTESNTILDRVNNNADDEKESTATFLDRFLSEKENGKKEPEAPVKSPPPAKIIPKKEVEKPVVSTPEPPVVPEPKAEPVVSKESAWEVKEEEKSTSVLDSLNEKGTTLADKFASQNPKSSIGAVNGNRKIQLDEIPIHKQYQYVQKVFDGNNVRFRVIVEKVNNAANKQEVEDLLDKYVLSNKGLNKDDQVVSEFISMLRNRF